MKYITNAEGTTTLSIQDYYIMQEMCKDEKKELDRDIKEFEEYKKQFEEGKILINPLYNKNIFYEQQEGIEKIIQGKKIGIELDVENDIKKMFYNMSIFKFIKLKFKNKKEIPTHMEMG